MRMSSSMEVGPLLLELLGVPLDGVVYAEIVMAVNQPVIVNCVREVGMEVDPDTGAIKTEVSHYKLVEDKEGKPLQISGGQRR